ncbi:hypothetical protein RQP46_007144 [Phenoliferia psychrophenolica]
MTSTDRTTTFKSTLPLYVNKPYKLAYSLVLPTSTSESPLPLLIFSHPFNNTRKYWTPQLNDPRLAPYPKVVLDALGFGLSATQDRPWDFDLAAEAILVVLDELVTEGLVKRDAVVVGDSMGGGPTGLRVALRDHERESEKSVEGKKRGKVVGVVACGTCAEEESADFVKEYIEAAHAFATSCLSPSGGPTPSISTLAHSMADSGYTPSPSFTSAREFGYGVINDGLNVTLADEDGSLDPTRTGQRMVRNYESLCLREGLLGKLASRPSWIGERKVLVVHGTEDEAYPFEREYHSRTVSAIGTKNAELLVVEGGPHFVTATHWELVDKAIDAWVRKHFVAA